MSEEKTGGSGNAARSRRLPEMKIDLSEEKTGADGEQSAPGPWFFRLSTVHLPVGGSGCVARIHIAWVFTSLFPLLSEAAWESRCVYTPLSSHQPPQAGRAHPQPPPDRKLDTGGDMVMVSPFFNGAEGTEGKAPSPAQGNNEIEGARGEAPAGG